MITKVLLVDDEKDFVDTLSERLKIRDLDVSVSYTGKDALEIIKNDDIDVIVLDVMMPEMTGSQALKIIKDIKPLTQVIMLTGAATVETAIEGMKSGAFDYLLKPISTEDLVKKIQEAKAIKKEQDERIRKAEISNILKRKGW